MKGERIGMLDLGIADVVVKWEHRWGAIFWRYQCGWDSIMRRGTTWVPMEPLVVLRGGGE